jgi:hypothetical protein
VQVRIHTCCGESMPAIVPWSHGTAVLHFCSCRVLRRRFSAAALRAASAGDGALRCRFRAVSCLRCASMTLSGNAARRCFWRKTLRSFDFAVSGILVVSNLESRTHVLDAHTAEVFCAEKQLQHTNGNHRSPAACAKSAHGDSETWNISLGQSPGPDTQFYPAAPAN